MIEEKDSNTRLTHNCCKDEGKGKETITHTAPNGSPRRARRGGSFLDPTSAVDIWMPKGGGVNCWWVKMQWRLLLSGSAALISSLFASLLACVSVRGESEWCTASSKQAVEEEEEAWPTHKSGPVLDQADSIGLVDRPSPRLRRRELWFVCELCFSRWRRVRAAAGETCLPTR